MPRIDLWAVDCAHHEATEKDSGFCQKVSNSTLMEENRDGLYNASESWNSFVEQVDSVCSSASVMILVRLDQCHFTMWIHSHDSELYCSPCLSNC